MNPFYKLAVGVMTVCLCLVLASAALAARPSLSLDTADKAALTHAYEEQELSEEAFDPTLPIGEYWDEGFEQWETNFKMDGFDLDACERDGRSRAECDITFFFNDGDICDDTIEVYRTRRGRLVVEYSTERICDSYAPA